MGYFKEVNQEMKKVTWPSAKEVNNFTWIVIFMVIIFAVYFGITDQIFTRLLHWLLSL